jgi:hypothetical protein
MLNYRIETVNEGIELYNIEDGGEDEARSCKISTQCRHMTGEKH